jgi:glycosyltransferase involved in cell wall biosynthesis
MIVDASDIFPIFVTEELKKWGTNINLFSDLLIYNVLSASKFVNDLIKKQGRKFDVICVHDWLSSIAGIILKNMVKIPMVFHVHSTEWGRSGGEGSEVISHLEEMAGKLADRIITVSYAMKDDLTHHGWPEPKISVVWNGVDPDRYDPAEVKEEDVKALRTKYGIGEDEAMLLFVGRLTWVKAASNLIRGFSLALKRFPKTKLIILGKGEEEKDLAALAGRLGICEQVVCRCEFVPEEERILHYAASDVCIFPSIYEPFGIVSLEAMAMEKPIVVGARGVVGFKEQVTASGPYQNGAHVNGNDPADIAWGIGEVLSDPQRARKWGENGRKHVLDHFTWRKAAEHTLKIYEDLRTP